MKKVFKNVLLSFGLLFLATTRAANNDGYDLAQHLAAINMTQQEWNDLVSQVARELRSLRISQLRRQLVQLKEAKDRLRHLYKKAEEDGQVYQGDYLQQVADISSDYHVAKQKLQKLQRLEREAI